MSDSLTGRTQPSPDSPEISWQSLFPWLNNRSLAVLPEPLKRDLETRAVDRFFVNWILYPGRDGGSIGHMHDLPKLYHTALPDSVLWHAVRAVAFADLRHTRDHDVPFNLKAQRSYGAALNRIRIAVETGQELLTDDTFSGLLLIDSFEVLFDYTTPVIGFSIC